MTPVFLDTVGILALLERSDQWHEAAAAAWAKIIEDGRPLRTTTLVFFECGNAVARKPYSRRISDLWDEFQADGALIEPGRLEIDSAWQAYRRGESGNAGIVDHVSFAVMKRLGLIDAFTSDGHFRAAGFRTLF